MADIVRKTEEAHAQVRKQDKHEEVSLKGTFAAVMILGGFLALTWLAVFALFISRH